MMYRMAMLAWRGGASSIGELLHQSLNIITVISGGKIKKFNVIHSSLGVRNVSHIG